MVDYLLLIFTTKKRYRFWFQQGSDRGLPKDVCFGDLFHVDRVLSRAIPRFSLEQDKETKEYYLTLPCLSRFTFANDTTDSNFIPRFIEIARACFDDLKESGMSPVYVIGTCGWIKTPDWHEDDSKPSYREAYPDHFNIDVPPEEVPDHIKEVWDEL